MEEDPEILKLYNTLSEKFTQIAQPMKIRVSKTSIFNPITVIRSFSKPLFGNQTLFDNFSFLFSDFIQNLPVKFVILFTKDLMEIGDAFSTDVDQATMKDLAQNIFQKFNELGASLQDLTLVVKDLDICISTFKLGKDNYYLTYGYNKYVEDKIGIATEAQNLLSDVKKFLSYL